MRGFIFIIPLYLVALAFLPATALAEPHGRFGGEREGHRGWERQEPMRPMMIPNEMRREHGRQSAKCMNAYPENHSEFSRCIANERGNSTDALGQRRMFMPIPTSVNE